LRKLWPPLASDIGSEVDGFVEQNASPCQHPLDRLSGRVRRDVDLADMFACDRLVLRALSFGGIEPLN
jgi:hypothetical protein